MGRMTERTRTAERANGVPFVPTTQLHTPLTANTPANGNVPQVAQTENVENAENANDPFASIRHITGGARNIMTIVAFVLGFVVLAPLIISGQDLYHWAQSRTGLNLQNPTFALLIPVVFDLAATSCIGMTIIGSVWRKERSGLFGMLVWVFAASSAFAQYRNGVALARVGVALDARWAFPLIALLGPLLLEATLNKLRKWARQDDGNQANGAAGFGSRWIPGVAFRETLAAWAVSRREGISQWEVAVAFVREQRVLRTMSNRRRRLFLGTGTPNANADAVWYAVDALGKNANRYAVRLWLQRRGVNVAGSTLDAVLPPSGNEQELIRVRADVLPPAFTPVTGEHQNTETFPIGNTPANESVPSGNTAPAANTDVPVPPTFPVRTNTPVRAIGARTANGNVLPASDQMVTEIEGTFPDWRTTMPSARMLSAAVGAVSPGVGMKIQRALNARLAQDTTVDQ
jgi:hypothetical protein